MVASKPTLNIFTGGDLGKIYQEQNQIMIKFAELNTVFSTTRGRLSTNVLGKTRIIVVQGANDGTGFTGANPNAKLYEFVYQVEAWLNQSINTTATYTDSLGNSYTVDAIDWTWVRSFTDPNRLLYTLILKETAG